MAPTPEDLDEMARLLAVAEIPAILIPDLARCSANTVIGIMSIGQSKLGEDPPHPGTLHAFLAALRDGSTLPEGEKVPDRASTLQADQVAYYEYYKAFTILCRLAKMQYPVALERLMAQAALPTSQTGADMCKLEEKELKEAAVHAQRLRAEFKAFYNVSVGMSRLERRATPEQLVKTHQGLRRGQLLIAPLKSAKYGAAPIIEREEKNLKIQMGSLVQVEETTQPARYSKVLLAVFAVMDSIAEGGMVEIDPAKQTAAGVLVG